MRHPVFVCWCLLVLFGCGHSAAAATEVQPLQFEVGRHTFFDFGPPSDFYELYLVSPTSTGSSIVRITLTPPGDACVQPATVEVGSRSVDQSVSSLLGKNPCLIPEKDLRRELKRCKKCLVFSGASVALQVKCSTGNRIIRADVLDKDMFDSRANTPQQTSWTMQLLSKLDKAVGPSAMDRPIFSFAKDGEPTTNPETSGTLRQLSLGEFDPLFKGAPDKPSDLYRASQIAPPRPLVELASSMPVKPTTFVPPVYPPLARSGHITGSVTFTVYVSGDGGTRDFTAITGHPWLRSAVEQAVAKWKFPKEDANQKITATIGFNANCPSKDQH